MRKILLFLFAVLLTANIQAALNSVSYQYVDSLPYPRFIRDIRVDTAAKTVTFEVFNPVFWEDGDPYTVADDTYLPHEAALNHRFQVVIFNNAPYGRSKIWKKSFSDAPDSWYYTYGELVNNSEGHPIVVGASAHAEEVIVENTAEKLAVQYTQTMDISAPLDTMLARGYTDLRVAVIAQIAAGFFYSVWAPFETRSTDDTHRRTYLNNYVDISYPTFSECALSVSSNKVNYGENFSLTGTIKGTNKTKITLQYQNEDQTWKGVEAREISPLQAQEGYTYTYKRVMLNDYPAARTYRLKIQDLFTGNIYYSNTVNVTFKYRLNKVNISSTYYSAGDHIILGNPAEGKQFTFSSDYPVLTDTTENGIEFDMPACNVLYRETYPMYTVKFYDYDYTLLKEQQVLYGDHATPPTAPSHAGMTFIGWDKEYTNIQQNMALHAQYRIEGLEGKLFLSTPSWDEVKQGENVERLYVDVKSNVAVPVRAYIQSAWLEHEGDELQWEESSSSINFTADEAAAGASKWRENVTILPNSQNDGYRARYFRARLNANGTDTYTGVLRVDLFYPVNINTNGNNEVCSRSEASNRFKDACYGDGTLYSRPGDTVWVRESKTSCALDLDLWMGWQGAQTGQGDYGWTYIVMPEGYGQNAITVNRQKHTVLFYAEGHHDGYWNLIHGEGVYEPQEIVCGNAATPPEIEPELTATSLFLGWKARGDYADDAYLNVTEDMIFDAVFQQQGTYLVTFVDWDDSVLDVQTVLAGGNACPPDAYRDGYELVGWDSSYTNVNSNRTIKAIYEEIAEGIEQITNDELRMTNKVIRDGQLYIERNGKTYNAQGAEVR